MKHMHAVLLALLLSCVPHAHADDVSALIEHLGIAESDIASRDMPGWSRPTKIALMTGRPLPASGPGSLAWYQEVAGDAEIEILPEDSDDIDYARIADSDVYMGWCDAGVFRAAKNLKYIHIYAAGIDPCMSVPEFVNSGAIITNSAKESSETIAEHGIAMMFMLTRNLTGYHRLQMKSEWGSLPENAPRPVAVTNKTMLVLGLGGIGSQAALRAHGLGMRVIGTRNSSRSGPDYVDYVGLSDEMVKMAAEADVVFNAMPLTDSTRGSVNALFFDNLKDGAYYISVGRGATTDTKAMLAALNSGKLAGAGLDVTDPEPLPADHPLWQHPNVIITPHSAGDSDLSRRVGITLRRENLRRYVNGDKLLNLVDIERGY